MKILFCFFLLMPIVLAAQDNIVTGLEESCQHDFDKWFPPGASISFDERNSFKPKENEVVDLSIYLPAVGNQGVYGACTAFSVASALSIIKYEDQGTTFTGNNTGKSNLLYSPAFIFNIAKSAYPFPRKTNCADGISFIDAFNVVRDYGILTNSDFKYQIIGNVGCDYSVYYPSEKLKDKASKNRLYTFQRVERDLKTFQYLLSRSEKPKPINIAVYIDKNYRAASEDAETKGYWLKKGDPIPGQLNAQHAMVIVGYSEITKCFKVLDSKGSLRGDRGFLWMSYDLLRPDVIYDSYISSFDDEILKIAKGPSEGDVEVKLNSPHPSWLKQGYRRSFNGVTIGCMKIDKQNETVVFNLEDRLNVETKRFDTLLVGQERTITFLNQTFSIHVRKIGFERHGPFQPAAFFNITFSGTRVVELFDESIGSKSELVRIINGCSGKTLLDESGLSITNDFVNLGMIYRGSEFVNSLTIKNKGWVTKVHPDFSCDLSASLYYLNYFLSSIKNDSIRSLARGSSVKSVFLTTLIHCEEIDLEKLKNEEHFLSSGYQDKLESFGDLQCTFVSKTIEIVAMKVVIVYRDGSESIFDLKSDLPKLFSTLPVSSLVAAGK